MVRAAAATSAIVGRRAPWDVVMAPSSQSPTAPGHHLLSRQPVASSTDAPRRGVRMPHAGRRGIGQGGHLYGVQERVLLGDGRTVMDFALGG